jgi:multidrug efflux pump subunit AcrA (membrane-fusion protein)
MEGMAMEGAAAPTVRLAPGQAERIGLRWAVAAREPILRTVRVSASVRYPEDRMEWVSSKVSGWVERLHVTFEGAPVRAGQPLLDLYSPELVTAQEELLLAGRLDRALPAGDSGGGLAEVARRRLAYWDIPDAQVDRLLETGEVRKTMTLEAPATGIVMKKQVFAGQGVKAGENLFMIAPTDPVWIEAAVPERDLPFVREGLPAEVTVEGLPGRAIRGRVSYLYPELREATRTVVARIEAPNPRGEQRPGMYVTARIESRTDPVLSLPATAVLHTGTRAVVFRRTGEDRLMPTGVETGRSGDDRVEILSGLEPGTRVAASAQFLLDSEANLMEAMQAMMAQMGRAGEGDMEMEGMEMEEMEGTDPMPGGGPRDSAPASAGDTAAGGRR